MKPDWKNETGNGFESHAENVLQAIYPWLLNDLKKAFGRSLKDLTLLEIGCGPGFMNQQFISAGVSSVSELDLSHAMLLKAKARTNSENTHLMQADAAFLPCKNRVFDIVFSRGSIFFWEDITRSLEEIKRVLKPGGMAFIGGGYGLSTPDEILSPILEHAKLSDRKGSIPRIDLEKLAGLAQNVFASPEILQARKRGFWLKCFA